MNVPRLPEGKWRTYALVAIAATVLLPLVGRLIPHQPTEREHSALLQAAHSIYAAKRAQLDSVKKEGASARVVYVARRRSALDAVEHLPQATLHGDVLTISDTAYTVPHPIAEYVAALREVIRRDSATIIAADSALAATVKEVEASEKVTAAADTVAAVEHQIAEDRKPGFLAKVWGVVRGPVLFTAGATLGYVVARVVP